MAPAHRQQLPGPATVSLDGLDVTVMCPTSRARILPPGKVCSWRMYARMLAGVRMWEIPISATASQDTQAATVKTWSTSVSQTLVATVLHARTIRERMNAYVNQATRG